MTPLILAVIAILLMGSMLRDLIFGQTGVVQLWGARRSERPVLFWSYIVSNAVLCCLVLVLAKVIGAS